MGSSASTPQASALVSQSGKSPKTSLSITVSKSKAVSQDDVCRVLMPIYFTSGKLTPAEKERVGQSWKIISSGQAPEFWRLKKADPANVPCESPTQFFGQRFINRFLEVHPAANGMFSREANKQGPLFYRMIAFTVAALDDETKFDTNFTALARSHNRMGVRAVEYGIFGECLFYVLRLTLGAAEYDAATHLGWVKVVSRILSITVPIAVRFELENEETLHLTMEKRFAAKESSTSGNACAPTTPTSHTHEGVFAAQKAARDAAAKMVFTPVAPGH